MVLGLGTSLGRTGFTAKGMPGLEIGLVGRFGSSLETGLVGRFGSGLETGLVGRFGTGFG
jgi:hypothetical protein